MHGATDWRDHATGKILWWRVVSGLVTALVLGEIATGLTNMGYVNQNFQGALAAVLGYLGPAATIGLVAKFNKFLGGATADANSTESKPRDGGDGKPGK